MAEYINNKEFYQMLVDYRDKCVAAENDGKPQPRIPDNIGMCFMMIAQRLSSKSNFAGYTYRDEMVSDALENCVTAIRSFNPDKSTNPFAYFTQIIWYAFLRRIEKEKKQTYVKYKALEELVLDDSMIEDNEGGAGYASFELDNEKMIPIIEKFEKKKEKKKKKHGIEKFIEDEPSDNDRS